MKACRTAGALFAVPAVLFVACEDAPKPAVPAAASASAVAPFPATAASASSVGAALVSTARVAILDLPARVKNAPSCQETVIAVTKGHAEILGESLGEGDALVAVTSDPILDVGGAGRVVAVRTERICKDIPPPKKRVVRAAAAPELSWAKGQMHAHLDVGPAQGSELYVGRLSGTAPVAEHVHETSWEFVANAEASGVFTIDGVARRLGPNEVVAVPPGTKHAWTPDPGTRLVAVQVYDPPGPEQRFVKLSDAEARATSPH